jgi:uncharacterized protein (DUF1800 family)
MSDLALHAFRRFGLGRRGNEPVPRDVAGWLRSQLDATDPLLSEPGPSAANSFRVRWAEVAADEAGEKPVLEIGMLARQERTAALQHAVATDLPFRERLVWFWTNHFCISARGSVETLGAAGAYVQEAIRPNMTGRLADMLKAVMRHPAMLGYLDGQRSIGPDSPIGRDQHRGINENLARESLELHTLGVGSGYTQRDVIAYAAILTGRVIKYDGDSPGYRFRADMHEPGPQTLMGQTFGEGFAGSEAALEWLAAHPATHLHVATHIVRHFIADDPPANCVERVATVLKTTDGDLKAVMLAIIDMPEAWQPLAKFQAPAEYVIAVQRALDLPLEPGSALLNATFDLGQEFLNPLLPNGWPDTASDWLFGEAILKRADWAMTQASRPGAPTAEAVADATLGDLCSASTRTALKACATPAEALATLFASPEFLRR